MILAAEAPLRKETNREIIFGHRPLVGLFYICVGTGILVEAGKLYGSLLPTFENAAYYFASIVFAIFGVTIFIMGFWGVLKRLEKTIQNKGQKLLP